MYKILAVDDTKSNLHILIELLSDEYDILVALDGKSAIDIINEEKVDLILLDIMMPEMDGFEVCQILKSDDKTKDIPIIFITANNEEEAIEKAYEVGGNDYVTKPFKPKELKARVKRELELRTLIRDLEFLSSYDSLTGIYNRRKFFELSKTLFNSSSKNIYAIMIDIDKFKNINDTYGHPVGDEVIKTLAKNIKNYLKPETIFARLGGEEFSIMIDLPIFEDIKKLMEELRGIVENLEIKVNENEILKFTISIGISKKKDEINTLDMLLKEADDALYSAKGEGRNRVIFRS